MGCSFNDYCPATAVPEVNIINNTTTLRLAEGDGRISIYEEQGFSGTELTLPTTIISGYALGVYVNGLLQSQGTHFNLGPDPRVIIFTNTLVNDDVQVRYATTDITADVAMPVQILRHSVVLTGTVVTIPVVPGPRFPVTVYVNGVLQAEGGDYTRVDAVITFNVALAGAVVQVLYSVDY